MPEDLMRGSVRMEALFVCRVAILCDSGPVLSSLRFCPYLLAVLHLSAAAVHSCFRFNAGDDMSRKVAPTMLFYEKEISRFFGEFMPLFHDCFHGCGHISTMCSVSLSFCTSSFLSMLIPVRALQGTKMAVSLAPSTV